MGPIDAVVLGIVEGVTEYLPVSSTGHLILTQRALGIGNSAAANAYAICIQGGAIVAVLGLYMRRVNQMALGLMGRSPSGRRMATNIVVAFLPAAMLGPLFNDTIEAYLLRPWPVTFAWAVGGVAILLVGWLGFERRQGEGTELDALTWRAALLIGLLQCVAMWPGTSRSLVTILGGVLVGLSLPAAVEFSFLLGVVTLSAATAYKALEHGPTMLEAYGPGPLLLGFVAATVSAVIAVKWMVSYLKRHSMAIFGYYRVALAALTAVLILLGLLTGPPEESGGATAEAQRSAEAGRSE